MTLHYVCLIQYTRVEHLLKYAGLIIIFGTMCASIKFSQRIDKIWTKYEYVGVIE